MTPYSARLVWTIGAETDHGDPIISYDVEGETDYHPGQWTTLMTGKIVFFYTGSPYLACKVRNTFFT